MNANRIQLDEIKMQLSVNSKKYIDECEQFFKAQVNKVLNAVMQGKNIKFILLAGPSSSGKTTTSKLLCKSLNANGFEAVALSLDDFFVEREETPLWKDGTYNFETYEAIDWDLFGRCIKALLKGEPFVLPTYNFKTGYKEFSNEPFVLKKDTIVIIEGLHALNPIIDKYLPKELSLKAYTSANTDIYTGATKYVQHENVRLYRRLIRDVFTRNISIERTISYWEKVNLGEELYINPHIDRAEIKIDSFHAYELSVYNNVLKTFAHFDNTQLEKAKQVLEAFGEIDFKNVPEDSVLQEFIPNK